MSHGPHSPVTVLIFDVEPLCGGVKPHHFTCSTRSRQAEGQFISDRVS